MTQENDSRRCIGFVFVLATVLFMAGCAPGPTLDLYDEAQRTDEDVATIVPNRGCWHCVSWIRPAATQTRIYTYPIRENPFDTLEVPGKFRVPPGRYEVGIWSTMGKTDGAVWVGYVDLKPGQTYDVKNDRCTVFCWGSYNTLWQTWVWMEDVVTGEVLLGLRTPQNDFEGAEWYRFAAQQGKVKYQERLAGIYEKGQGVPQNYVLAYMWYSLASSGDSGSANRRDQVVLKMTPEQIAEAQRLAKQRKPKAESAPRKTNAETIEENRLKLEAQCAAQPERC